MLIPDMQSIPAYEQVKIDVVIELQSLRKAYSEIMQYIDMNKYPKQLFAFFKSETLAFFMGMRPKILDYSAKDKEYAHLIKFGDYFIPRPDKLQIGDAVRLFLGINQFCEDYRLTSTTFYMGSSSESEGGTF